MSLTEAAPGAATEALAHRVSKRRSFRVVRHYEVPQELNGYRMWRSIARVIEDALETVSIRPDVQRRIWRFLLVMLREHGAPALWGRAISISKHSLDLLALLGMTEGELRTVLEKVQALGLIELISKPRVRKRGSAEYKPYHYVFGLRIREVLSKIFAYLSRRTKSHEYTGVFPTALEQVVSYPTNKELYKPTVHSGDLAPSKPKLSDDDLRARFGRTEKRKKDCKAPNLDEFDGELAASIAKLGARIAARGAKQEPKPEAEKATPELPPSGEPATVTMGVINMTREAVKALSAGALAIVGRAPRSTETAPVRPKPWERW